ncbi:SDR family NAD(P)-dependent oxidoreductase [Peribacillus frigoritolerans]|uniref:SDR family NAD(P)-dependent oxidoreductase n=1 Tax=Peribacillus frigoritolerans TaxID=450367 RepID=UPI003D05A26C
MIGRAASITLSENGAKVVVVDLSEEAGMLTVNKIKENGCEVKFVKADVTKEADIKNYIRKTIDSYGEIDIFLNNAGWESKIMPLIDYPTGGFRSINDNKCTRRFLGLETWIATYD